MSLAVRTRVDLLDVARRYARRPHDWPVQPRFDHTSRWYTCLAEEPDAQVWLLTWLPGQGTDLHDHGGSAGAFVVISGALSEQTVVEGDGGFATLAEDTVAAGAGRRFGSHHVHRMTNTGRTPAISIHAYGPALEIMHRYDVAGGRLRRIATDRAGTAW